MCGLQLVTVVASQPSAFHPPKDGCHLCHSVAWSAIADVNVQGFELSRHSPGGRIASGPCFMEEPSPVYKGETT